MREREGKSEKEKGKRGKETSDGTVCRHIIASYDTTGISHESMVDDRTETRLCEGSKRGEQNALGMSRAAHTD